MQRSLVGSEMCIRDSGVAEYQEIGLLPGGGSLAFDISESINENDWLGAIAAGLFNFNPQTSWLQLVAWSAYIVVMLIAFTRQVKAKKA